MGSNNESRTKSMEILHENDFGYISKCNCCDDLQLNFGNVIISLSEEEYLEFDTFFNEIRKDFNIEKEDVGFNRKYIIHSNLNGLTLSFSNKELQKTIELLNFSTLMLSVNELTKGGYEK